MKRVLTIFTSVCLSFALLISLCACLSGGSGSSASGGDDFAEYSGNEIRSETYVEKPSVADADFASLYAVSVRSVVGVRATFSVVGMMGVQSAETMTGTGFIVNSEYGYVVTSTSLLAEHSEGFWHSTLTSVDVIFSNGTTVSASVRS